MIRASVARIGQHISVPIDCTTSADGEQHHFLVCFVRIDRKAQRPDMWKLRIFGLHRGGHAPTGRNVAFPEA